MVLLDELMIDTGLSTGSNNLSTLFELEHTIKDVCQGSNTDTDSVRHLQEATFLHSVQLCSTASGAMASVSMSFSQKLNSGILT